MKIKNIPIRRFLSNIRKSLEDFGRAILVPVTVIPLLALIGAIGYAGQAIATEVGTYQGSVKIAVDAIKNIGMIAITNIDFLVAIGLAAGLAKSEKVAAALSGLMAYAALHFAANLMLQVLQPNMLQNPKEAGLAFRFGVMSFQYSAFGGMIAGIIGYKVHKWTYKLKFPEFLSFFGGPRFSPVASTLSAWIIGMPLGIVWIYISKGLVAVGEGWKYMGAGSPFLYGIANRALIPFGLHQVMNYFLYYTEVGASWIAPDGKIINGIYNIAIAKLGLNEMIYAKDTWIINGTFPTNMFSLTGAAVAMYFTIPKQSRKVVGGAVISAALASFLAGTTEPIEFTFIFTAPYLYIIHIFFTGFVYMSMYLCNFAQVSTRGSGLITWIVVNGINWKKIQNVWGLFIIGPIAFGTYFITFYYCILKFSLKTPGRVDAITKDLNKVEIKDNKEKHISKIIEGLGGKENIIIMGNCVTRLRVTVKDINKINKNLLEETKPYGIKDIGNNQIHIIYGPKVVNLATDLREFLGVIE